MKKLLLLLFYYLCLDWLLSLMRKKMDLKL
ncbi:hypothetical protein HMPREF1214_01151 [Bacteroides sp. HPS0048]|nr:hypothetical protein HMPREF1214_01151 [Bacteroides sp. HPS0048]